MTEVEYFRFKGSNPVTHKTVMKKTCPGAPNGDFKPTMDRSQLEGMLVL